MDTAKVEVHPDYESLEIIPTTETQIKEGSFNKVTVAGDENLKAENISKGTSIFGVEGTANTTSVKITDASRLFYGGARTNYLNEFLALLDKDISDIDYMFYGCKTITALDLSNINTDNITDMSYVFTSCINLTDINVSNFDTSNVINMSNMFSSCSVLDNLDLSNFDMSKVTVVNGMLLALPRLTNFRSFKNLGKAYTQKRENNSTYKLDLSTSPNLTHESLMNLIINGLYDLNLAYDVANGGTLYRQSLVLGSANLAKLTAEEIAIATNKGWNVS